MNNRRIQVLALIFSLCLGIPQALASVRCETLLENGWKFARGEQPGAESSLFDDSSWKNVSVPHDWAIDGPFSEFEDRQEVAIVQDGETEATVKTGRTGGLPYTGIGWYRTRFDVEPGKCAALVFDGAMSNARVYVNGREVIRWPYGYNSFYVDINDCLNPYGKGNVLAVRLENLPESARWYPGAGLYRNVHLVQTEDIHVATWGSFVTTPKVSDDYAVVRLAYDVKGADGKDLLFKTRILGPEGSVVAEKSSSLRVTDGVASVQNLSVANPSLWTPETPFLYEAVTEIYLGEVLKDRYSTRFGIRTVEFVPDRGMFLNGKPRKFKGVCNHHDLGPLGAAVNRSALRHQIEMLKDMGCDAIRTSHNMPAPELVELCDEMGMMMMVEAFDEWDVAKCRNGYHLYFDEWAEKDLVNMVRHYRNSPSVFMWSIGNEVPTQSQPGGFRVAARLQDICHREDPTRKVTSGVDRVRDAIDSGFAAVLDIPGLNYRDHFYEEAYAKLPAGLVLGSETASTVSSRGVYKFPVTERKSYMYPDHQCSGYDTEACYWSNLPELDFALQDDFEWTIGQFVWTGFDYLGEPTPYGSDWPNHSSMFGIIDLSSQPKDRFWLYRSVWNPTVETLHILPHWNWEGREGENVPVFVYTNYDEAELFLNGRSLGRRHKYSRDEWRENCATDSLALLRRYRLIWEDVPYEKGELSVVAYKDGREAARKSIRTAGKAVRLVLSADRTTISAGGKDLAYITVKAVDRDGNLCPLASSEVRLRVSGSGSFKAAANGDPTCLDVFSSGKMHLFGGSITAIVQSGVTPGVIKLEASVKGLKTVNHINILCEK